MAQGHGMGLLSQYQVMMTHTEAINAFVDHVWQDLGIDISDARTKFLQHHDLKHEAADEKRLIPHYCTTCGVLDHLELPRT